MLSFKDLINNKNEVKAIATFIRPHPGSAFLTQKDDCLVLLGSVTGFVPGSIHGFHAHAIGNLSNQCLAAGPHYNPFSM